MFRKHALAVTTALGMSLAALSTVALAQGPNGANGHAGTGGGAPHAQMGARTGGAHYSGGQHYSGQHSGQHYNGQHYSGQHYSGQYNHGGNWHGNHGHWHGNHGYGWGGYGYGYDPGYVAPEYGYDGDYDNGYYANPGPCIDLPVPVVGCY